MAQRAENGTSSDRRDTPWVIAAIALSVVCTLLAGITIRNIVSDRGTTPSAEAADNVDSAGGEPDLADSDAALVMSIEDYRFKLSGFVDSDATRDALQETTTLTYGDRADFDVAVDPNRDGVSDVQGLEQLPQNLARLINGSFEVTGSRITMRGLSPDLTTEFNLVRLATGLGFVDVDDQLEVAELRPPTVDFQLTGDQITATGEVTDAEVVSIINDDLVRQFGAPNVDTSQLVPNAEVFSTYDVITTASKLDIYSGFGAFQLMIQNNDTVGAWDEGIGFASGDSTLTSEQEAKLAGFPPLLKNRPDLQILITGHTDDQGPADENQELSQARAQAIVDFFVANGVDVSRVIGIGRGANEPIASNDTEEGRAQNRRVTFALR